MIAAFIDEHREQLGVEPMCRVLTDAGTQVAPCTYYAAKTRPASARSVSDAAMLELVGRVHEDNYASLAHARSTSSCAVRVIWSAGAPFSA